MHFKLIIFKLFASIVLKLYASVYIFNRVLQLNTFLISQRLNLKISFKLMITNFF